MILDQEHIKQTVQKYFRDKPVKKVYLFGSYARGDAGENSDVDLLVELDYKKKIGLEFVRWTIDLGKIFQKKIDLVPEDTMYASTKMSAEKDKIAVI